MSKVNCKDCFSPMSKNNLSQHLCRNISDKTVHKDEYLKNLQRNQFLEAAIWQKTQSEKLNLEETAIWLPEKVQNKKIEEKNKNSKVNCNICSSTVLRTNLNRHVKTVHKKEILEILPRDRVLESEIVDFRHRTQRDKENLRSTVIVENKKMREKNENLKVKCEICFSTMLRANLNRHIKTVHKKLIGENLPRDRLVEAEKFQNFNVKKYLGLRQGFESVEVKVLLDFGEKRRSGWSMVGRFYKEESFKKYLDNITRCSNKVDTRKLARKIKNQLNCSEKTKEIKNIQKSEKMNVGFARNWKIFEFLGPDLQEATQSILSLRLFATIVLTI
jgi:hypothetical protein